MPKQETETHSRRGNFGNPEQHAEAGRKGAEVRKEHGTGHTSKGKSHPAVREDDKRHQDNLSEEQRSAIGRKGGEAVSEDREHMAEIGRKGGEAVSEDREHMAEIGRKGGESRRND
jgi:hypothetical protein